MFKYLLAISFFISFSSLACTSSQSTIKEIEANKFLEWLGNSSEFSKIFLKSKCLLDKELESLTPEKKRLIAKLISKSYEKKLDEYYSF